MNSEERQQQKHQKHMRPYEPHFSSSHSTGAVVKDKLKDRDD